jgi:hypothetical protein
MWICGACGGLFGKPRELGPERERGKQRCSCRREPRAATWDRFDFNEYVHLCECCLQEVLPSGSKFSVWFCPECKDRVVALNDDLRVWLIPIGRHSFQAHTYDPPGCLMLSVKALASRDPAAEAAVERFRTGMLGLVSSIDRLGARSKAALLAILPDLGFAPGEDVPLPEYLRRLDARAARDERYSKAVAFERLRDHMLDGREPARSP